MAERDNTTEQAGGLAFAGTAASLQRHPLPDLFLCHAAVHAPVLERDGLPSASMRTTAPAAHQGDCTLSKKTNRGSLRAAPTVLSRCYIQCLPGKGGEEARGKREGWLGNTGQRAPPSMLTIQQRGSGVKVLKWVIAGGASGNQGEGAVAADKGRVEATRARPPGLNRTAHSTQTAPLIRLPAVLVLLTATTRASSAEDLPLRRPPTAHNLRTTSRALGCTHTAGGSSSCDGGCMGFRVPALRGERVVAADATAVDGSRREDCSGVQPQLVAAGVGVATAALGGCSVDWPPIRCGSVRQGRLLCMTREGVAFAQSPTISADVPPWEGYRQVGVPAVAGG